MRINEIVDKKVISSALLCTPLGQLLPRNVQEAAQRDRLAGKNGGSWEIARVFEADKGVNCVAFSPNGKFLAIGAADGATIIWAVGGRGPAHTLKQAQPIRSVAFAPDSQNLATCSQDRTVVIWNTETGEKVRTLTHAVEGTCVAYAPDGTSLASALVDLTVGVWSLDTHRRRRRHTYAHANSIKSLCFHPGGKSLFSGSEDEAAVLWDIASGQRTLNLTHTSGVVSVDCSPDGNFLASASSDKTASIWEHATGRLHVVLQHESDVRSVAFSPDSRYVSTASADLMVRIWDCASGKNVDVLSAHTAIVNTTAFSPCGQYLATGADDHACVVWVRTVVRLVTAVRELQRRLRILHDAGREVVMADAPVPETELAAAVALQQTFWIDRLCSVRKMPRTVVELVLSFVLQPVPADSPLPEQPGTSFPEPELQPDEELAL
jgi:WD40 repeat protein